jgi:hypothetical protein
VGCVVALLPELFELVGQLHGVGVVVPHDLGDEGVPAAHGGRYTLIDLVLETSCVPATAGACRDSSQECGVVVGDTVRGPPHNEAVAGGCGEPAGEPFRLFGQGAVFADLGGEAVDPFCVGRQVGPPGRVVGHVGGDAGQPRQWPGPCCFEGVVAV